ncbi:Serine/threonine-protein kinase PknA [Microbacterium oxydans]|uniref:non-specific serine/threonine protein kinase n=1 Tax=Microbacterium oxydans TaxID=82380 RepID=A0A3Q9J8L2_9MICO|nr:MULTISPECIES: serine/threonine-protein kinase [Microbacterium]AZS41858.1 Serine/threonine-protein kinase PknA [Microbacterium oxydans]
MIEDSAPTDSAPTDSAPTDSAPTQELLGGRYQLRECVGQGGMARVYRAEDVLLGRTVAIKLLNGGSEGVPSDRARSEMTLLASLNHPAMVTLYDAQLVPGKAEYLVMEFVDGPTLSARIAQGPVPPTDVAMIAADLAEALHVVHGAGVVHRDVKPSNVLLSPTSLPGSRSGAKLADFGISVLVDDARLTSPGVVIGTAAYLAPEQLRGAPPAPAADIYSLGLVLLEALTGKRAFGQAEGIGAAMARLIEVPEVPRSVGPQWAELLARMVAIAPEDRPSAAAVFAAASMLASAPAIPPRPPVPVIAPPVPAMSAASAASTAPTLLLSSKPSDRVVPTRRPTRRWGVIGTAAAAVVAASVLVGVWAAGQGFGDTGDLETGDVDSVVTEQTPGSSPSPDPTPDQADAQQDTSGTVVPVVPAENTQPTHVDQVVDQTKDERKAAEQAAKDERKAQEEAQKKADQEQERADKEQEKRDAKK